MGFILFVLFLNGAIYTKEFGEPGGCRTCSAEENFAACMTLAKNIEATFNLPETKDGPAKHNVWYAHCVPVERVKIK